MSFLWLMRGLLALAVIWVVVRWPKAAGPGIFAVVRRLMAIVVLVVLGTVNVLAPVNAQWGWYTTWTDITSIFAPPEVTSSLPVRGAEPAHAAAAKVGPSPLAALPTTERASMSLQLTPTAYGGYQTFTVPGPKSGFTGQVTVWVPPTYTDPEQASRTFPVLEGFHGYLPAPLAFFTVYRIDSVIGQLANADKLREPLVVIPHWSPNKVDTECVDGPAGRIDTWMTQDVPAWVYRHFRVPADRDSWATIGGSAGGWCALMSTMLHPTQYSAAISMAGYTTPSFDPPYTPFRKGTPQWAHYDLSALTRRQAPSVALWTLTSPGDSLSFRPSQALAADARAPLSVTPTVMASGGHRAELWVPYFPTALTWLASTSRGFTPA